MLDSLLGGSRSTLCLNIAEPGFQAEDVARAHLESKGRTVETHSEPSATAFAEILEGVSGKTVVVTFDDLDKSPKCIDLLLEHVKKPDVDGKLVVVSRHWNSDNTPKELELRKFSLFYTQNLAKESKKKG